MADLTEAKELYTEAELAAVQAHIKRYFGDFQQSIKEYESPDICLEIAIIPPRPEQIITHWRRLAWERTG